jgi:hypothetical protein
MLPTFVHEIKLYNEVFSLSLAFNAKFLLKMEKIFFKPEAFFIKMRFIFWRNLNSSHEQSESPCRRSGMQPVELSCACYGRTAAAVAVKNSRIYGVGRARGWV